jgi:AcrR family transcriptional regulator
MATAKIDRRTERTRTALMAAFVDLLLTRGYAAVTVEEIAARANVGRSTFYMHFSGKDAILKRAMQQPSAFLATIVGQDPPPETLVPLLVHFREQRKLNWMFFSWPIRPLWADCLAEMIEPRLATLLRKTNAARPILPLGQIAQQLAQAQIALVAGWLVGKFSSRAEAVAEALVAVTHANMRAMLRWKFDAPPIIPGEKLRVPQGADS